MRSIDSSLSMLFVLYSMSRIHARRIIRRIAKVQRKLFGWAFKAPLSMSPFPSRHSLGTSKTTSFLLTNWQAIYYEHYPSLWVHMKCCLLFHQFVWCLRHSVKLCEGETFWLSISRKHELECPCHIHPFLYQNRPHQFATLRFQKLPKVLWPPLASPCLPEGERWGGKLQLSLSRVDWFAFLCY